MNSRRTPKQSSLAILVAMTVLFMLTAPVLATPKNVSFAQSQTMVETYDFIEIVGRVDGPDAANPFMDANLTGSFGVEGGALTQVDGFCDSADGSAFRIRFMPSKPGDYTFHLQYKQGEFETAFEGKFKATGLAVGRRWNSQARTCRFCLCTCDRLTL